MLVKSNSQIGKRSMLTWSIINDCNYIALVLLEGPLLTAIKKKNRDIKILSNGAGKGIDWVETQSVVIYGCYISPNIKLGAFLDFLLLLSTDMKKKK